MNVLIARLSRNLQSIYEKLLLKATDILYRLYNWRTHRFNLLVNGHVLVNKIAKMWHICSIWKALVWRDNYNFFKGMQYKHTSNVEGESNLKHSQRSLARLEEIEAKSGY